MAVSKNTPYRILQTAFTAGEISNKVENRVDLDKYQYAILKGENALIHPCGPIYKRAGMEYVAKSSYANIGASLVPFSSGEETDYLLEVGHKYIRVFYDGAPVTEPLKLPNGEDRLDDNGNRIMVPITIKTDFEVQDLPKLRFTQSADTLFISSGVYPVMKLSRHSHTDWRVEEYKIDKPYFDESLGDATEDCTLTPSATEGDDVIITSSEPIFDAGMVGAAIQLKQDVDSSIVSAVLDEDHTVTKTSEPILVGEQWKFETSGAWTGNVTIERSFDNETWKPFRKYGSTNSNNYTEAGTVTKPCWLRFVAHATKHSSENLRVNLTAVAYTHTGWATITAVNSDTEVTVSVAPNEDAFGTTNATKQWAFSPWCKTFGYPRTVCFFQDRLCFGGTQRQPYTVWMSRTGNYTSFEVETAGSNVLDDSAVCISFISRNKYSIMHMIPAKDLIVLTNGNEWIIAGNEVITPSSHTPQLQTSRGCNDIPPILVGNRLIYVQRRGFFVRDMGYRYDTDTYDGTDMTLLSSHIIEGYSLTGAAYKQEPDSTIYFTRNDGVMVCLAYVYEQKVFAWSTIKTDGEIISVASVREGNTDAIYVVVKRDTGRLMPDGTPYYIHTIERMGDSARSNIPNDYIMLDCSKVFSEEEKTTTFSLPDILRGKTVDVLGDGRMYKGLKVDMEGLLTLPSPCKDVIIGLPYAFKLQMLDVNVGSSGNASQGLKYHIASISMRVLNALGGEVGTDFENMDDLHYDEYLAVSNIKLYSGDMYSTLPLGGYGPSNKLCIKNDTPYPFCILSIVREVAFGD